MNISAVEAKTGLSKANIRYYEGEGLITPSRLENGYRDYTEDNIETLMKIKLLRELKVPLEKIRGLQDGTEDMRDILEEQFEFFSSEQEGISHADRVCRSIYDDGAEYDSLDAAKYLTQLHAPQKVSDEYLSTDAVPYEPHPWYRYFARSVDLGIYTVLSVLVFFVLTGTNVDSLGNLKSIAVSYGAFAFMFLFEPLLIHFFGTTPGKLIAGIYVYDEDGNKLSYGGAFKRLAHMFLEGMGLGIPIVVIILNIISCKKCDKDELEWDKNISYTYRNTTDLKLIACIAVVMLLAIPQFFCENMSRLPPNRGELTVAEFSENYNFYSDIFHPDNYYYDLDENGNWYAYHADWVVEGIEPPADFQFVTDENGNITKIIMDIEWTQDEPYCGNLGRLYWDNNEAAYNFAIYAAVMAQEDFNPCSFEWTKLRQLKDNNTFVGDYSDTMHNVSFSWEIYDETTLWMEGVGTCHAEITINR